MEKEYLSTGETAVILGISRATVSRKFDLGILAGYKNRLTGERFIRRESALEFLAKASQPATMSPGTAQHTRQHPRTSLGIPVQIQVYVPKTPERRFLGKGVLENISLGGAYVSRIETAEGFLPAEPCRMEIHVENPPFHDWRADGKVVRLEFSEWLSAAIEFDMLPAEELHALQALPEVD
jgi:hypothetical protein